jgi:hypothetical protein
MNAEDSNNYITEFLQSLASKFVPTRSVKSGARHVYLSKSCRKSINKKAAAFKRYRMSKSSQDYHAYAKVRNKVTNQLRSDRKNFERKLAKECKKNSKKLFAYYRSKSKAKTHSNNIRRPDGDLTSTNEDAAKTLNDHFTSVFNKESAGPLPSFPDRVVNNQVLSLIEISENEVLQKLINLDPGKSPGPDTIYPRILKYCAITLASPLMILYNKSLKEGTVPTAWKLANVVPIHKKRFKTSS